MLHRNPALCTHFIHPWINLLFQSEVLITTSRSDISQFVEIALLILSLEIYKIIKEVLGNFPKDGVSKAYSQISNDAMGSFKNSQKSVECH